MTPQQIVGLAVRLFSIWLVVIAFQAFGIATAMNAQFHNAGSAAAYLMIAFPLLLALIMWWFPMAIAHKLVPKTHDTEVLKIPARDAAAVASAILGMWALVISLPHVIAAIGIFLQGRDSPLFHSYFDFDRKLAFAGVLLQALLGLFLVSRPWQVANKIFPLSGATSGVTRQTEG